MKCKSCNTVMSNEDFDIKLKTVNGTEKLDIRGICPDCGELHFKFVETSDLITNEDFID